MLYTVVVAWALFLPIMDIKQLFAEGEVNIVDNWTILTEPEVDNCFIIISELNKKEHGE